MSLHRLFIGLDPPAAIKQQLLSLMGCISAARWQDDEQLHLTLRFIGEVDRRMANDIALALQSFSSADFDVHLAGVGTFEKRGQVHTLYAAAHPAEALTRLHKKCDHLLVRLGLDAEPRAFVPHVTLARLAVSSGTIAHFLSAHSAFRSDAFAAREICLYESQLLGDGPRYTIVARYPLTSSDR